MPIRDRTTRRLVRLGVIRLGHKEERKRKDGSTYTFPTQDDHFVLTDAPEIAEVYGNEPRELDVLLPFPDLARNFDAFYQVWAGGVLVCQGDGEYVQYATPHRTEKKGDRIAVYNAPGDTLVSNGVAQCKFAWNGTEFEPGEYVPCPGAKADAYPHCAACKLSAMLKIMMSDVRLFRMGYYQISTGSGRNYDTIMGTLEYLPAERLNGIPFKLRLVEESATFVDTDGQRKKTSKWFLQLEPDPTWTRKLYERAGQQLLQEPQLQPVARIPERASADPDWEATDFDEADDPLPPPLAQDQAPGEPATNETEQPAESDTTMPSVSKWPEFKAAAVKQLGYKNEDEVTSALRKVFDDPDKVTFEGAWNALIAHQKAKEAM